MGKQNNNAKWKKRFFASVLAVSMTACLAVGFASCRGDSESSSSSSSEVVEKPSFELNVFQYKMLVNTSYQLQVEADEGVDLSACVWSSSNSAVVTVDSNGFVMAVGAGEAVVTVTAGEYSSSCKFIVSESNIAPYLTVNTENNFIRLNEGGKFALSSTVEYNGQSYDDFTCGYVSSNENIVTVSSEGEITAVACGKAKVTLNAVWRNGVTLSETVDVEVISGAYISVDKRYIDLFTVNPTGYNFVTSADIAVALFDKGEEKDTTFTVEEVLENGASANEVAVYEDGTFTAVGRGSTKFIFSCEYKGEVLTSYEVSVTVSAPNISLEHDFYQLKESTVSVDLAQTGVSIASLDKVFVNGVETAVNGTTIALDSAETGSYEIGFYINNEDAEYSTDLIIADYFIESVDDLLAMQNDLEGYYVLTQDIDAQGASVGHLFSADWYGGCKGGMIGEWAMKDKGFKGTLDGNGHTISNIAVDGYGLFGTVSPEGVIKNLGIRNVICSTTDGLHFPLATEFYGTMENVSFHMTNATPFAPIGMLQFGATLKNVVFYVPNAGTGAICVVGDSISAPVTFENVFVFSNRGVGGIQGNAPNATIFEANDYLYDARFIGTDFTKIFDMRAGGEWFIEEDSKLPLINWTPNEYLPLVKGEMKPFDSNEDMVFTNPLFDTVRAVYVGETELSKDSYTFETGSLTIKASYLSTLTNSTIIVVKTSAYKVECVLQVARQISSVYDFNAISNDWYGYYELTSNIDFGGEFVQLKSWGGGGVWFTPSIAETSTGFYGTFEGNGYILKNFQTTWGIFGGIGDTAVIRNVGFENIQSVPSAITVSAVIATYSYGRVENISVKTADSSNFYAVIARLRGNALLKNAVIYAKQTDVGLMESSFGTMENVYFVSNIATQSSYTYFNVDEYLTNNEFLAIDFTSIFDCNGMWKMDETLKLPFIYSDKEMVVVEMVEKTFKVSNLSQVTCSDSSVALSMTDEQLVMTSASFNGTTFTITITLPEKYAILTSILVKDLWSNGVVTAWIGENCTAETMFIGGDNTWGDWYTGNYTISSTMIRAAGYDRNQNQVTITVKAESGVTQVIFNAIKFTYLIEKADDVHTHDYTIIDCDDEKHWYKCECDEIDEQSVVAHSERAYEKNQDGTYTAKCVCGKALRTLEMEEKTFNFVSLDSLECSDDSVSFTPVDGQIVMDSQFADANFITLTFTLPEKYAVVTGIFIKDLWTNGNATVCVGGAYNEHTIIIGGANTWSEWAVVNATATAEQIALAGVGCNGNTVSITLVATGSRVVFNDIKITYLVEKTEAPEPEQPDVEEHQHDYTIIDSDDEKHWYKCECDEIDEQSVVAHSESAYEKNQDGTYTAKCVCGKALRTLEMEEKTFTVSNANQVTCSDSNVTLSMNETQFFMNAPSFNGTPFTITITLPETYLTLKSISVQNVWTNDGGSGTSAWVGATYDPNAIFIGGTSGWGGDWVNISYTATTAMIQVAGYDSNKNQVTISVQPNGGTQVVFNELKFTYLVEKKTEEPEPEQPEQPEPPAVDESGNEKDVNGDDIYDLV